jgi:hypothetical protein
MSSLMAYGYTRSGAAMLVPYKKVRLVGGIEVHSCKHATMMYLTTRIHYRTRIELYRVSISSVSFHGGEATNPFCRSRYSYKVSCAEQLCC